MDLEALAASTLATLACLYYQRWDDDMNDPGMLIESAVEYAVHRHGDRFAIAGIESKEVRADIVAKTHQAIENGDFTPVHGKWAKWAAESDEDSVPMLWLIEEILRGRRVFKRVKGREMPTEDDLDKIIAAQRIRRAKAERHETDRCCGRCQEPPF